MMRTLVLLLVAAPLVHTSALFSALTPQARGVRDLATELSAPDPEARAAAACALRDEGDAAADAIPQLAALLADASPVDAAVCRQRWMRWDGDRQTTPGEIAAAALVAIGGRAFQPLIKSLASSAWAARRNAAWALGALDDARAVGDLEQALGDAEAPVREQAAWALGALDERQSAPALIAVLKDSDSRVRRQAAWALGAIGDRRAVDGLILALRDADKRVREQSAWALGAIGEPRAIPGLLPALKDPDASVRRQAAWAIGAIGH